MSDSCTETQQSIFTKLVYAFPVSGFKSSYKLMKVRTRFRFLRITDQLVGLGIYNSLWQQEQIPNMLQH